MLLPLQVVASLIQLQELAQAEGRTTPLHTIASVRHPRTIELINYITAHGSSRSSSSHSMHSMQASPHTNSGSQLPQHHADDSTAASAGALGSPHEGSAQSQTQPTMPSQGLRQAPRHHRGNAFSDMQAVTGQHDAQGSAHSSTDRHGRRGGAKQRHEAAPVLSVDVLLPDELLSGLLTQCSVQPELLSVMEDLFDSAGAHMGVSVHVSAWLLTLP